MKRTLSKLTSGHAFYQNDVLERYGSVSTKLVTLRQLSVFGRRLCLEKLLKSANYLRTELPVRLAHRILQFQQLPFLVGTNPSIRRLYELYWEAFETFRQVGPIHDLDDNEQFCETVRQMLTKHSVAISLLAKGIAETSHAMSLMDADRFVNDTLRSRIGRRVLAEQHLALSDSWEAHQHHDHDLGRWIGIIDTECHAEEIIQKSFKKASEWAQQSLQRSPPSLHVNGNLNTQMVYIPSHLELILFELIKNALQAVMTRHAESLDLPKIQVTIGQEHHDVMIRISDQGGGIDPITLENVFSFADKSKKNYQHLQQLDPNDELPIGLSLPLCKLYASYWGGSITLYTMHGFSTDVYVHLSVGNEQEKLLSTSTMESLK